MRSPQETLEKANTNPPRIITDVGSATNGQNGTLSPSKTKPATTPNQTSARRPGAPPGAPNPGTNRPEDNKDSPEYKKKVAMATGPILNLDYENSQSYGMNVSLFTSLKDLFEAIIAHQSRMGVVSPNKFLQVLRDNFEVFRTAMHQDAHEFLNLLLNEVVDSVEAFSKTHDSSNMNGTALSAAMTTVAAATASSALSSKPTSMNTGWVHELFEGTLTSETRCLTCENTSQRDEVFLDLSVDLEQHSSVTSCLRKFSEEEMLCERNKFHCDRCGGLQEAEKRMKIKRLPHILALHLKRFKYTEDLRRLQKLFHRVVYPFYLRLFNTTDDAEDPDRLYELYAVVVHIGGGPYHGHYVSIIKTQDRGWLLFDDEMVEPVDKSYVRNFFGGENVLACAYVLFYQETTFEAMQKEQEAEGLAAAKAEEKAKEDGHANGLVPNGHTASPTTPVNEEPDHFANLDHAATVNVPLPQSTTAVEAPLEPVVTSPAIPTTPVNKKTEAKAKKEQKAAEKAAKKAAEAAAKEEAKALQIKRNEASRRRIEQWRKEEEEMQAAIAASKASKAEEDQRTKENGGQATAGTEGASSYLNIQDGIAHKMSGLSRFRQSSMSLSLKHKPKFWGGKKEKEKESDEAVGDGEANAGAMSEGDISGEKAEKKEKNRFSLGKKRSTLWS
jgi:ubiquitin carboxyl-terminal hydrolase 9/13